MNPDFQTIDGENTIACDFELQALTPGMTLCGKYRLEKEAGKGGMGVVWKAWDSIGERWVALKFIPPEIRHKEAAMAQVKAVFQTVQALNHPNICPVYCLENDSAYGYFIVKKWLEGQSLSEVKLPREQIIPVLEKVADALDYAHSEGVLHRDVKPSNIFLGDDGKVTLFDFGIAANLHPEAQATKGQFSTSGTDKYMAPEQRKGELQTAQTDEYALALAALELLAGTLSPLAYRKISPEIQAVLDRALSDEPSQRFATCREFVDALSGKVGAQDEEVWEFAEEEETERPEFQPSGKPIKPDFITHPLSQILSDPRRKPKSAFRKWTFWGIFLIASFSLFYALLPSPFQIDGTRVDQYTDSWWRTRAVIPKGVTEIGWGAFKDCTHLKTVVIPESVTEIDNGAFSGCSSLKSVVIPDGVTAIRPSTFSGCTSLESVEIPESVKSIGWAAFYDCRSLKSVVIPKGVEHIVSNTFFGCSSLTSVKIPNNVEEIEFSAFAGCKALKEWSISPNHPFFKTDGPGLYSKDGKILYACIASVKEYRIPDGVMKIGDKAFSECSGLTSVTIPEGVVKIGIWAFSGCSELTSVEIPESVTEIDGGAFSGCSALKSAAIPAGVTAIRVGTFLGCTSLQAVTIPAGVTVIEGSVFSGCTSLTSVTISEGVTTILEEAFKDCKSLTSVTIPESVTRIGTGAFENCPPNMTIYSPEGSQAEVFAKRHEFQWKPLPKK